MLSKSLCLLTLVYMGYLTNAFTKRVGAKIVTPSITPKLKVIEISKLACSVVYQNFLVMRVLN